MKTRILLIILFLLFIVAELEAQEVLEETSYLPQFETSRTEIQTLEENLAKTGALADILKKGNDELSEAIKQYKQDHSMETKDRIYGLLGDLAGQTVTQIENIVANKDQMRDGVSQIIFKMRQISLTLAEKHKRFQSFLAKTQKQAEPLKKELKDMARKIKKDPENDELRRAFRTKLYKLKHLDHRHKTYKAHERLNAKFAAQVKKAEQFFEALNNNTDQLIANLEEQKEFLVMKVGLLKDAAQMESWLRGEGASNASAFSMMKKIGDLSQALEKFNAATDVLIEMNDIGTIIDGLPDAGEIFGIGGEGTNGARFEDKYVDYFLKN